MNVFKRYLLFNTFIQLHEICFYCSSMYCRRRVECIPTALRYYYVFFLFRLFLGITYAMLIFYTPYFVNGDSNNGSILFFLIYEFHRISRMVKVFTQLYLFHSYKPNTNLIYIYIYIIFGLQCTHCIYYDSNI